MILAVITYLTASAGIHAAGGVMEYLILVGGILGKDGKMLPLGFLIALLAFLSS